MDPVGNFKKSITIDSKHNGRKLKEGFKNENLKKIKIPDSITTIEGYAFEDCSFLTIYCEASSQPSEWNSKWNSSDCLVCWKGEWEYVDGILTPLNKLF